MLIKCSSVLHLACGGPLECARPSCVLSAASRAAERASTALARSRRKTFSLASQAAATPTAMPEVSAEPMKTPTVSDVDTERSHDAAYSCGVVVIAARKDAMDVCAVFALALRALSRLCCARARPA